MVSKTTKMPRLKKVDDMVGVEGNNARFPEVPARASVE
jgi:hypothetical protein